MFAVHPMALVRALTAAFLVVVVTLGAPAPAHDYEAANWTMGPPTAIAECSRRLTDRVLVAPTPWREPVPCQSIDR